MKSICIFLFCFVVLTVNCYSEIPNDSIIEFQQYNIIADTYGNYFEGKQVDYGWHFLKGFIIFCKNVIITYEEWSPPFSNKIEYYLCHYYNDGRCIQIGSLIHNSEVELSGGKITIVNNNIIIICV